jgi:VanZ family protein
MKPLYYSVLWVLVLIVGLAGMFVPGSPDSGLGVPGLDSLGIPHLDKLFHFAFLLTLTFGLSNVAKTRKVLFTVLGMMATFGVCAEELQRWVPYREFSFLDMAANLSGVVVAAILVCYFRNSRRPI